MTSALDTGGLDEVVVFLALGLRDRGFEVEVILTADSGSPGKAARRLVDAGVAVRVSAPQDAAAWFRQWRPDVVSAHGAPDWMIDAAAALDIPVVEVLHGMHDHFGAEVDSGMQRGNKMARVVAVSDLVRRQYLAVNPSVPGDKVVTIPNGFDRRRFGFISRADARRWLSLTDEYVFISLARLSLQKNTYGLVSAFDEVAAARRDCRLLIAGDADPGRYPFQVNQLKHRLRHHDRLELRRHCESPAALLAAADGFVLDSFFEGWSLASMEALANGVPCVLSDVGGAREQLAGHRGRGILVGNPLGDPVAVDWTRIGTARFARQPNRTQLVQAMIDLVDERDERSENRQRISEQALEDFDPARCLDRHFDILLRAASPIEGHA